MQVGDLRLTYVEWGDVRSPPVVLVHALFMTAADWRRVAEALAKGRRVIAVNLRGHGTSDWPGSYSFASMARDLVGFMDALGLDRAAVVGHSLGGIVATLLAAEHGGRVSELVLEEAPPPRSGMAPIDPGPRPRRKVPYDWAAVEAIVAAINAPDPALWELPRRIDAPTLIIGGGPTSHVPQQWNADLAAAIEGARLVTLGGGHFVHAKQTRRFVAAVEAFFSEGPSRSPGPS